MPEATNDPRLKTNLANLSAGLHRITVIGLVGLAIVASMGAALISLFKLWVLLTFVAVVWVQWRAGDRPGSLAWPQSMMWLFALWIWMTVSALWSPAEHREQWLAFDRYSRLLVLPVVWYLLIRTSAHIAAARGFVFGQLVVLISSYAMMAGWPVPWATAKDPAELGIVFTSTLEQPIMMGLLAWILFQLGDAVLPQRFKSLKWILIALALFNVLFLSMGRSGYVVGGLVIFLMSWQLLPKYWKFASLIPPILTILFAFNFSERNQNRTLVAHDEVKRYAQSVESNEQSLGSQGQRLNYWARSMDMVRDQPFLGVGLGAWRMYYLKYGGLQTNPPSNPHQQYLLMATEGGFVALALLLGWLSQLWRDAGKIRKPPALRGVLWVAVVTGLFNCPFYGVGMGEMLLLLFALLLNQPNENQA